MKSAIHRSLAYAAVACLTALSAPVGCSSAYYSVWQKLGYEKRDILVSRVEEARDDQTAAKKQFATTLDQFKALTNFNGGDLETEYKKINSSYESCQDRATAVSKKIVSVNKVATDMFAEWNTELDQYHDANLRASSEKQLNDSKTRYQQLLTAMKTSETKMQDVLGAFHDEVLRLKHDLNAAAISSLQQDSAGINSNVQDLIKDMDASINEANAFIDNMKKS